MFSNLAPGKRGQAWDKVAEALNIVKQLRFHVDQRGVRERYEKLKKAYQKRMREEVRASGISPEINVLDEAIESIVELSEVAEKEIMEAQGVKNKLSETERETAESVRKRSMERLSQTRERENLESSKKRRSGNGMVEYLQEKEAREEQLNKIDVELRERHFALEERKHNEAMVIEQNKVILREKELAILANQQEEREKRDGELLSSMRKIIEQQQEIIKQLQQQMHLLTSIEKKQLL